MNNTRCFVINKISELLHDKTKSINVEKSIFNFSIEQIRKLDSEPSWDDQVFCHIYSQKSLDTISNLSNIFLKESILNKEILSKDVAYLRPEQMQKKCDEFQEDDATVAEGIFQCKACGSKKTTFYSLQTRSADEPMTNFITCVQCKNRWKM